MSSVYLSTCKISTTYFNIEDFIDRILSKVKKKEMHTQQIHWLILNLKISITKPDSIVLCRGFYCKQKFASFTWLLEIQVSNNLWERGVVCSYVLSSVLINFQESIYVDICEDANEVHSGFHAVDLMRNLYSFHTRCCDKHGFLPMTQFRYIINYFVCSTILIRLWLLKTSIWLRSWVQ